jgi:thiamine biosynthesis lipoprotein
MTLPPPAPFPSRRETLLLAALGLLGSAVALAVAPNEPPAEPRLLRRSGIAFGTTVSIALVDDGRPGSAFEEAFTAAFAAIRAVQTAADLFDPASELSRLNRDGRLAAPSADLLALVTHGLALAEATGGAFDPTVQPLWAVRMASAGRPAPGDLAAARSLVDHRAVRASATEIAFTRPGMAMTLNGLAQGHATDRVAAVLAERGIDHAFLDTGELGARGRRPDGRAWRVAIADPRRENSALGRIDLASRRFVATSADDRTAFTADRLEHHIVEPWSGRSPRELAEVVVVAASGLVADGLSTALMVTGRARGAALVEALGDVAAVFVTKSGAIEVAGALPALDGIAARTG